MARLPTFPKGRSEWGGYPAIRKDFEDNKFTWVGCRWCETTPFVNTVGAHYVASRAHIEQACDSLRSQGRSITAHVGLSKGDVHPVGESRKSIVEALLEHVNEYHGYANSTILR